MSISSDDSFQFPVQNTVFVFLNLVALYYRTLIIYQSVLQEFFQVCALHIALQ